MTVRIRQERDTVATAYIGLGSNLGDRAQRLRQAVAALARTTDAHDRPVIAVVAVSSLWETAPVGYLDQPPFLNAVARIEADLDPPGLLGRLKAIEAALGRTPTFRNGPRAIDLDLLLYGDLVVAAEGLQVPHPRLAERAFVLAPLAEIAPDVVEPVSGLAVAALLARLAPYTGVEPVGPFGDWKEG